MDSLKVGDVFKCKRRGHEIIVSAITSVNGIPQTVFYRNIRGSMVRIKASRLLKASRFERMAVQALKSENELPAETQAAVSQAA